MQLFSQTNSWLNLPENHILELWTSSVQYDVFFSDENSHESLGSKHMFTFVVMASFDICAICLQARSVTPWW